jgi:plasmid rolling circle replication initiator protein Rep
LRNGVNHLLTQCNGDISKVEESVVHPAAEPEFLSEWSPRDKPWDTHRAAADQIANMYGVPEFQSLGARVALCSLWLGFAWAPERQDASVLALKLREAHFCRVRHCPICQWRRSLMWVARLHSALPKLLAQHPKARFIFLTLTQKNPPIAELRITLRGMGKAWERLSQRRIFRIVLGWIRTTEVTRGKDGTAHPHFHALLMVSSNYFTKNYVSQQQWVEIWRVALRVDYDPVVDVRVVKNTLAQKDDLMPAIRETLKYSVKPADMLVDAEWFWDLTRQLHKLRFIASGGALKSVLRPEQETEEDLLLLRDREPCDEKASVYFNWQRLPRRYKRAAPIGV